MGRDTGNLLGCWKCSVPWTVLQLLKCTPYVKTHWVVQFRFVQFIPFTMCISNWKNQKNKREISLLPKTKTSSQKFTICPGLFLPAAFPAQASFPSAMWEGRACPSTLEELPAPCHAQDRPGKMTHWSPLSTFTLLCCWKQPLKLLSKTLRIRWVTSTSFTTHHIFHRMQLGHQKRAVYTMAPL